MAALDRERVIRFQAEIEDARQVLSEITSGDAHEFLLDPMKMRTMKYTLIVMVEAICNPCRHVLAKRAHTVVEEYMEAIIKMYEKGFLSEELANQLTPLTKLRHQLIHGYWKTDDRWLFNETKSSLEIIKKIPGRDPAPPGKRIKPLFIIYRHPFFGQTFSRSSSILLSLPGLWF